MVIIRRADTHVILLAIHVYLHGIGTYLRFTWNSNTMQAGRSFEF